MPLILDNVNYIYGEGSGYLNQALRNVSLTIGQDEFIGIIGHTGSGKSTLAQIFNGLIKPADGHVFYNGEDIHDRHYDIRRLRQKVGVVFQYPEHQLFGDTVLSDVCFGPKNMGLDAKQAELKAYEALKLVRLDEKYYDASPFELSGGQKRKAAIAGILAMHPEILALDEPTAGLDPRGEQEVLDTIKQIHEKTHNTVVLISHSMEQVAMYCDRVIVMNAGEVLCDGEPAKVFSREKELEDIGLSGLEINELMRNLRKRGLDVKNVLTPDEGYEQIKAVLRGR